MPDDREVRLEGISLWIAGGVLAALVVGAFWVGRATAPAPAVPAGPGPLDAVEGSSVDTSDAANFFDQVGGQGKPEPGREARPGSTPPPPVTPVSPGSWFVQVFAGRDREAAEVVVGGLRAKGWPVKVETQREGSGALYRVRVGGYVTREQADEAVQRLRAEGRTGAWVTHAGP